MLSSHLNRAPPWVLLMYLGQPPPGRLITPTTGKNVVTEKIGTPYIPQLHIPSLVSLMPGYEARFLTLERDRVAMFSVNSNLVFELQFRCLFMPRSTRQTWWHLSERETMRCTISQYQESNSMYQIEKFDCCFNSLLLVRTWTNQIEEKVTNWIYLVGQNENLNVVEWAVKNMIEEKILRLVYKFWVSLNFRDSFWSKKNSGKLIGSILAITEDGEIAGNTRQTRAITSLRQSNDGCAHQRWTDLKKWTPL